MGAAGVGTFVGKVGKWAWFQINNLLFSHTSLGSKINARCQFDLNHETDSRISNSNMT